MSSKQPFFSIIVPTYGRPRQLYVCLLALSRLEYPHDHFEVIVVDDSGRISPKTVVDSFQGDLNIRLIKQKHRGPASARNTGAAQVKGEFLAFTDDDCAPASDWLKALATRFAHAPNSAIGGRTVNLLSQNSYSTASQLLIDYLYSYYNTQPKQARFLASNNLALPSDSFHAIGGFDTTFQLPGGEDREFCDRWLFHGNQLIYAAEAVVYHAHRLTALALWRQSLNCGRGAFRFHQMRSQRKGGHHGREPLSFYINLLRYPFSTSYDRRTALLSVLFMISQMANATGHLWERVNRAGQDDHSAHCRGSDPCRKSTRKHVKSLLLSSPIKRNKTTIAVPTNNSFITTMGPAAGQREEKK